MDGRDAERSLCLLVHMMCRSVTLLYTALRSTCSTVPPSNLVTDANIVLVFQHVEVGGRAAAVGNNKSLLVFNLEEPVAKGAHARSQDGDDLQKVRRSWFLDVEMCKRSNNKETKCLQLVSLNPHYRKGFIQHPLRVFSFSGVMCTKC